jgi:hypothetical protein
MKALFATYLKVLTQHYVRENGEKYENLSQDNIPAKDTVITSDILFCKAASWFKGLVADFLLRRPGFQPGSGQVGFVVDKVALGQVFSLYFGFPCQSLFHQILHHHHNHPGQVQ